MTELTKLAAHLNIAERAIEHHKTMCETRHAKSQYHEAWRAYELEEEYDPEEDIDRPRFVHNDDRICRNNRKFDDACLATKQWHDAYKAAKRAEYNAKRRLETAIRRMS